jgi:hypothetical protein
MPPTGPDCHFALTPDEEPEARIGHPQGSQINEVRQAGATSLRQIAVNRILLYENGLHHAPEFDVRKPRLTRDRPKANLRKFRGYSSDCQNQKYEAISGGFLAGGPGFEPRLAESESAVLPLNYPPQRPQRDGCEAHLADLMRAYPEGPP